MKIAIIGMSGKFPEASNLDEFYRNLREGKDSVRKYSRTRLKSTTVSVTADYHPAGYIERIDLFDHEFFNISLEEARSMDPNQRLLLEVAYEAIENAGYSADRLNGSRTAVFVGDTDLKYYEHAQQFNPTLITGNMNASVAGRISRFFNLRGMATMVDTSCSSSLVALHLACKELISRDADYALACGVNVQLFPTQKNNGISMGIESHDGKARSFAAGANGTVGGEAVGCLLLKPLEKAIADNDLIHAVIIGSGVNQDADLSGSLTAPSSKAQSEVITTAWEKAGIDPETITYIEAHGTGTKLGDPIEIQGMNLAFGRYSEKKQFCAVASLKSNIGHTDTAAGISGLIKAVLSLKHRVLFPSLHFDKPNPYIDFENSAVYVNATLKEWEPGEQAIRRAGVSSFGLSGTNCHVVLEEAPSPGSDPAGAETPEPGCLVTVSAKTFDSLQANLQALRKFLRTNAGVALRDVSYTLNAGRKHYHCRFAAVAGSTEELLAALDAAAGRLPVKRSPGRIILIFPDATPVSAAVLETYCRRYPLFQAQYERCREFAGAAAPNAGFCNFAFQYCFYRLLQASGVSSKTILGDGIGEITQAVVSGQLDLAAGVKEALGYDRTGRTAGSVTERSQALAKKVAATYTVFAEIGIGGSIGAALREVQDTNSNYEVVALDETADPLLTYVQNVYLANGEVDWQAFYAAGRAGQMIELPAYQFKKTRCWIKEPSTDYLNNWFYALQWERDAPAGAPEPLRNQVLLVVMDDEGLAGTLIGRLEADGNTCIRVAFGEAYHRASAQSYRVHAGAEDDYRRLKDAVRADFATLNGIIHLGGWAAAPAFSVEDTAAHSDRGVYAQFYLAKAFAAHLRQGGFRFVVVTAHAHALPTDGEVNGAGAMSVALLKGLLSDNPALKVNGIDLAYAGGDLAGKADTLLREMAADAQLRFVAYRNGDRYCPAMTRMALPAVEAGTEYFGHNGVYVVTGGATGIGLEVCKSVATRWGGHLIVLGRTVLPDPQEWPALDEAATPADVYARVKGLSALESSLATVEYLAADVSDSAAMQRVFARIGEKYGKITGVIHAAGVGISAIPTEAKELADFRATLNPKVNGTLVLEACTRALSPDFFVLFSSLNALVPQKNSADYAAANAFEDAFAAHMRLQQKPFTAINWPGWDHSDPGQEDPRQPAGGNAALKPIHTEDGLEAFYKALKTSKPNVIVAEADLKLFAVNPFFGVGPDEEAPREHQPAGAEAGKPKRAARQDVTPTEATLIDIWYEVLKAENIGPEDDFFDLGGHSLNGTQVQNRIGKELGIELEFEDMLEYPTLKELAAHIDRLVGAGSTVAYQEIQPVDKQEYYEISNAQRRLWIIDQLGEGRLAYNLPGAYVLDGELSREALNKAFEYLLQRHEILRTTFVTVGGVPKQKIHDVASLGFNIDFVDLAGQPDRHRQARELFGQEARLVFDLETGPLLRVKLIRLADQQHILLFNIHHIVTDAWSMSIIFNDVVALYNAFREGKENPLAALRIQYKDYAAWQNALLGSDRVEEHRQYWLDQFSGEIPVLQLPLDSPRLPARSFNGDTVRTALGKSLSEELEALAKAKDATLFMVLVASVTALLYRYTGQEDIVISSPIAGREHLDLEDQVGFYLNNLSLRVRFEGNQDFDQLLGRVKAVTLGAYAHQAYPYDKLVEDLRLDWDTSRAPLFDVVVVLQNAETATIARGADMNGIAVERYEEGFVMSKTDLRMEFNEGKDGITLLCDYNTDIFARTSIERMLGHYRQLLASVTGSGKKALSLLDMLPAAEKHQLLHGFNNTAVAFPGGLTVAGLFEEQVLKTPGAVALAFEGVSLTYGQLNEEANRLAHHVREAYGVKANTPVALLLERSERIVIAMLGVLKAGGAYLPLDPSGPVERRDYMLAEANVQLLLTDSYFLFDLDSYAGEIFSLDVELPLLETSRENPAQASTAADLAYIIYTSGSTGTPKGVQIEHGSIANTLLWRKNYYRLDSSHVNLQIPSYSFDSSVEDIFSILIAGGKLVIPREEAKIDPACLGKLIEGHGVTHLLAVPSLYKVLLNTWQAQLPSLQAITLAGEPVNIELVRLHYRLLPGVALYNEYGPTENAVCSTACRLAADDPAVTIGKGIANVKTFIVDPHFNLQPVGVPGQLCVAGPGLARGYWNKPQLTAEKFVPSPFPGQPDEKIYLTGDIARWRPDGSIEYLGRKDGQVKIRGMRIELEEIEKVLFRYEAIEDAAVTALEDAQRGHFLVAYFTSRSKVAAADLRNYFKDVLPSYMLPSFFVQLEKFPTTATGKIDRKALPAPDRMAAMHEAQYAAPKSELEKNLVDIWQQILGVEKVGVNDNFFEVGGDSLKLVTLLHNLSKLHPAKVSLADLFKYNTVGSLVAYLGGENEKVELEGVEV